MLLKFITSCRLKCIQKQTTYKYVARLLVLGNEQIALFLIKKKRDQVTLYSWLANTWPSLPSIRRKIFIKNPKAEGRVMVNLIKIKQNQNSEPAFFGYYFPCGRGRGKTLSWAG